MAGKKQRKEGKKRRQFNLSSEVNEYLDYLNTDKRNMSEETEDAIKNTQEFKIWMQTRGK